MESNTSIKNKNLLVRADKDLLTPDNIISLAEHYSDYYEIINDLGFFISYKIQNQQTNLFNEYTITIKEFCEFTGRKTPNLQKLVRDEQGNVLVAASIQDSNGVTYQLTNVLEHALLKMTQPILLKTLSKYRGGVSLSFQNFNFIDGFEVLIPNKKTKQRVYKISLNNVFFGALLKSFVNLNFNNFNTIKGKKLYPLYLFLNDLKTTAELNRINNSEEVVSSPYFELLKKVCSIKSDKPSYIKQKIEKKLKSILQLTNLNFKHSWTTTGSMRFPFQLHIFWENDIIPKAELDLLYQKYSEAYYNFILNEEYEKYRLNTDEKTTFSTWFNLETTKPIKVKAFVKSYNFIQNKNISIKSKVIYNRFGVLKLYIEQLKTFHKEQLKAEPTNFSKWFNYIIKEKSENKNYKSIRMQIFKSCIHEQLGFNISNKDIYDTLQEAERMINL